MRNLTKASREDSRNYQFNSLLNDGFERETYKKLDFFTKFDGKYFTLKVYRGTSANHEEYKNYHTAERRAEIIANYKRNLDSREAFKAEQKAKGYTSSHAGASAAIKSELQAAFKGIKFSVTSESFSGGNSVHVSWVDGPTVAEVEKISQKYQYGHFNGMEDIYESTNSRDDIPQVKYVSERREKSESITALLPDFSTLFNPEQSHDYRNTPEQILYRVFSKTSFPAEYTNARIERTNETCGHFEDLYTICFDTQQVQPSQQIEYSEVEATAGEINIIDYSEKAFAVIGTPEDLKRIQDKMYELGGKFNKYLKCGAGYIFSKSKLEAVVWVAASVYSVSVLRSLYAIILLYSLVFIGLFGWLYVLPLQKLLYSMYIYILFRVYNGYNNRIINLFIKLFCLIISTL